MDKLMVLVHRLYAVVPVFSAVAALAIVVSGGPTYDPNPFRWP